jgi:hypothetical protein
MFIIIRYNTELIVATANLHMFSPAIPTAEEETEELDDKVH